MNRIYASVFAILSAFAMLHVPVEAGGNKAPKNKDPELQDVVTFDVRIQPEDPFDFKNETKYAAKWKVQRGQIVRAEIVGKLKEGWYTYPITQRTSEQTEGQLTKWQVEKVPGITPLWPILESTPVTYHDKILEETTFKYFESFTWSQEFLVTENATPGMLSVPIKLHQQICKGTCLKFDHVITVNIEVSDEAPLPPSAAVLERVNFARPAITVLRVETPRAPAKPAAKVPGESSRSEGLIHDSYEKYKEKMEKIAEQTVTDARPAVQQNDSDLLAFILAGIFWGAISLITPCVFPMIPITVSFFLKQSEKEHHRPVVMASIYSLTIVVVLTLAATFLLSAFRWLSIIPITNYFIGGLFVFFALSLFGMYEIELPNSLAQFTSAREGKGGVVGTIFMALTFTIISFACVAPFLGGFSGTAAGNRPLWHNLLGGLAFSATFAAPFFFLALFPALLRKMPKSGSWLNSVKVVMGFLELAAAFKFFRTAELIQSAGTPSFFTFDLVLGLWIAMSVLCGFYLLGLFRLPHDTPSDHITVPRLLFSAAFLGMALYLTPALFKLNGAGQTQRPGGAVYAWIDSFLLPDSHEEESSTANLDFAVTKAREEFQRTGQAKRIFIDFTGVTCTNCKINEKSVFTKPQISKLFAPYLFVKLYTDTVPLENYSSDVRAQMAQDSDRSVRDAKSVNLPFQVKVFGTEQLPLYAILEPQLDGKIRIVGVYHEGRINDEAAFAEFLRNPEGK